MKGRGLLLRLGVLAGAAALSLAGADALVTLALRGAWRSTRWEDELRVNPRHNRSDPELGYVRLPGISWDGRSSPDTYFVHYRTDERGFRNPPGVRRADIVFIGDSYTEGAQVAEEDTFARRVAQASGMTMLNLGLGGYGPQQELVVLRRYGLAARPKVVVWQMCEGNDLLDARRYAEWRRHPQLNPVPRWQRYVGKSLLLAPLKRLGQPTVPRQVLHYRDGGERVLTVRGRYFPRQPARQPQALVDTQAAVTTAARLCRERGIRFVVLFVPIMARVMKSDITFSPQRPVEFFLPGGVTDTPHDFDSEMERACRAAGTPFINLMGPLREAAARDNRGLFIPNDEHLDRQGHLIVAGLILHWLAGTPPGSLPPRIDVHRSLRAGAGAGSA